jgi:hypothetical protein
MRLALRPAVALAAILCSAAALAQSAPPPPPTVGDKPMVQVKPRNTKAAKPAAESAKNHSMAVRLQECLDIDDGTKERLNCYDAVIKPEPKEKAPTAKRVTDCKFAKEEDARLACFNGFVENMPKLPKS